MTTHWEPLTTADEVIAAHEAGKRVEFKTQMTPIFRQVRVFDPNIVREGIFNRFVFRALVESET